jgi:ABC-type molybdate transport system substrate-binding protein
VKKEKEGCMKKVSLWALMLALVFVVGAVSAQAEVVLRGSIPVGDVLTALSRVYMDKNPGAVVKIDFNILYKAQDHVLAGEADGVMVTDQYYKNLKTDILKFTPIAKRVVVRDGKIVRYNTYGIATVKISPELQKFLNFINSADGKEVLKGIPNVDPL